ncbi:MAG: hypothetical protein B6244_13730 [Candidatus Cloacimonetes bacterium 4572_55]|nr:MAG: hypothetical protein B6244_13730 [Candidatus Cloacimonetes bacterium 4572_55]
MRYFQMTTVVLLISCALVTSAAFADVTRDQAQDIVLNQALTGEMGSVDIYQSYNPVDATGVKVGIGYAAPFFPQSWAFLVDHTWFADWEHPCRYIFVDVDSGNYEIIAHTQPPRFWDHFEQIELAARPDPIEISPPESDEDRDLRTREPDPHLYAMLINGGRYGPDNREIRFWNHLSVVYCALTQQYGYLPENIFVHSTDGTALHNYGSLDLDGDGVDDIDYASWQSHPDYHDIEDTFDDLANELGSDDQLFVFITNHGDFDSDVQQSFAKLWVPDGNDDPNYLLYAQELADMVEPINCAQITFFLSPCNSGGFIPLLAGDHLKG